jgi:hypothetical protein
MTELAEFLFPAPARRTTWSIVRWWERRRLAYNAIVGAAGLTSVALVNTLFALPPNAAVRVDFPLWVAVPVGLAANFCYLLGPAAEIAIEKLSRGRILPTGPVLFRMGLTFSVGLVLLPTLVATFAWGLRILDWIF